MLALVAEGLRNGEIAERLVVSERTVDHHVSAILRKLGVKSRAAAGAAYLRLDGPAATEVPGQLKLGKAADAQPVAHGQARRVRRAMKEDSHAAIRRGEDVPCTGSRSHAI